ncbi:MAG: GcvT family protein [Gulosibacter sp.]|uniref:GcvT family protein n=1 Tax=Gulosibacter sp. TaxID=2817531 RepID=UPI003F8DBDB2
MERMVDRTVSAAAFNDEADAALPTHADVVVVGGGIIGSSIAYHLNQLGRKDVLLLEANVLASGTTWHAAGLVNTARGTVALSELSKYGAEFYAELEERSGIDVSFQRSGSISIARTPGRVDELRYTQDVADHLGIPTEYLSLERLQELWPIASTDGVLGALRMNDDAYLNPGWASIAIAKLAHEAGTRIREHAPVTELLETDGRITGVVTERGTVHANTVVLASGLWTRDLAAQLGVPIPLYAAEHVHVRSNELDGAVPELPVLRDLDNSYYLRHEHGRLLVGAFEPAGIPRGTEEIPREGFAEFPEDWAHFSSIRTKAEAAVPGLAEAGYDRFLNAPESFTPDTNFILGETAEIDGLFVAAGFNSQGIIFAPGVGKKLADWIVSGTSDFASTAVDVRRFSPHQSNRRYLHARTVESLGRLYAMHWPFLQVDTARNVRRTPLHHRVAELGACFGEINGLERAFWYGEPGSTPSYDYSYGRTSWFERVAEEHRATRENVTLFDLSPFAKFEVTGPDALAVCQRVATADVDLPVDKAIYTLFLNANGTIENDGTITRLGEDRFLVVTPSFTQHQTEWMLRKAAKGRSAAVVNASAGLATIAVSGPRSRELMRLVSPGDWSNEALPYTHGRRIEIGDGFAYCLRVSFVGELSYEIYASADLAENVFDALWDAGQPLGVKMAGYHALDSLRSEKGFRHHGHDIGPDIDPYSAGLGFTLAMEKPGGFIGQDAVSKLDRKSPRLRTVYVTLDDPEPLFVHDETLYCDGEQVGRLTSGAYGHSLGRAVGIALVDPATNFEGKFEVRCKGERHPATVSRRPFYDPKGERLKS